ncbi:putative disease resistance protein RGA4 [Argentina anserina]|uniref:putative disease resistance protein RGA4 n=1 Tax=Argentina anserina TaxID=57926 RepID=UPI00217635BD|nr:putative disease resistance protein RGA4 [Potentilla anserina]
MATLTNLRHFYFGPDMIFPVGILGTLTNLRSIPFVHVSLTGTGIEELSALSQLKDTLKIHNLEYVTDEGARKANLGEKKHLRKLILRWDLQGPSSSSDSHKRVLEGLRPHSNLEYLEIQGFMGVNFPGWLSLLNNLKEIKLWGSNKCEGVPVFGHLRHLRVLGMYGLLNLKCMESEFYGYDEVAATSEEIKFLFPALKILHIQDARNLTDWMEAPTGRVNIFPSLEELSLAHCDKLIYAPSHFPFLKKLVIKYMDRGSMPIASILSNQLTTLTSVVIRDVNGLTSLPDQMFKDNMSLAYLSIWNCIELASIGPHGFGCGTSLQDLNISECGNLRYFPDGLNPTSLRKLYIRNCPLLSSLPRGLENSTFLETLELWGCSEIISVPIPPHGLSSLKIEDCSQSMIL